MNYTRVIPAKQYTDDLKKCVREILEKINQLYLRDAVFINKEEQIFYLDGVLEGLQCVSFENPVTKIVVDLLVSQSLATFNSAPFFSDFSILYTVKMLKHMLTESASGKDPVEELDSFEASFFEMLKNSASIGTSLDFINFINRLNKPELSLNLIENSCKYAGSDGKIFIEPGGFDHTVLEVKNSHSFSVETFDEFFFENSKWNHSFVNCIVIDGIIESVSEIHHLLEKASKNVDPVILIARGFGDDVLQTLYVNMQRKTLNVFPLKLKSDENLVNSFVDISVVAKTDPVSYLKGELISSIDYDTISTVEHVEIKKGKLLMVNPLAGSYIRQHLNRIRSTIEEKRDSLDSYTFGMYESSMRERIRSLSSRSVHITLDKKISKDIVKKENQKIFKINISSVC